MSSQQPQTPRSEWTGYATLTLILLFIGAIAQALQVPHSLTQWWRSLKTPEQVITQQVPPVATPTPLAIPTPKMEPRIDSKEFCAEWASGNSPKEYDFICTGPATVDVHEIHNSQLIKIGSGKIVGSYFEAELMSLTKNRRGYWKLKLSPDKQSMNGTWHGDDPREAGTLEFSRVK